MNLLSSIFTGKINEKFSKDEIAKMLKTYYKMKEEL